LKKVNFANVRLESATGASRVEISKAAPAGRRARDYRWAATQESCPKRLVNRTSGAERVVRIG
jgi:hypothetical protein